MKLKSILQALGVSKISEDLKLFLSHVINRVVSAQKRNRLRDPAYQGITGKKRKHSFKSKAQLYDGKLCYYLVC